MSAPVQSAPLLQTYRLRTRHWAVPALFASAALHFALASWLGEARASTPLGLALVWGVPLLLIVCGLIASGEMARRRGGRLTVDCQHHQLVQRHQGLPEPAGTWEWSEIKDIRVRRRFAADLVDIDLGSQRLCACTQRGQGSGLVSWLRENAIPPGDPTASA